MTATQAGVAPRVFELQHRVTGRCRNVKEFGIWHEMDTAPKDGSHFVVRSLYILNVHDDDVHGGENSRRARCVQ